MLKGLGLELEPDASLLILSCLHDTIHVKPRITTPLHAWWQKRRQVCVDHHDHSRSENPGKPTLNPNTYLETTIT